MPWPLSRLWGSRPVILALGRPKRELGEQGQSTRDPVSKHQRKKKKLNRWLRSHPKYMVKKGLAKLVRGHKVTLGKKDNFRGPEAGQTLSLLKTKLCVPFNPTPKHCKQVSYCGYYWDQHIKVNSAFRTWYVLTETISNRGEWPEVLMIPGETPTKPGTDSGRAERSIEQSTHGCIPCSQHLTYVCGRSSMSWVSAATKGYMAWPRLSQHTRIKANVSVTRSHSTHTELKLPLTSRNPTYTADTGVQANDLKRHHFPSQSSNNVSLLKFCNLSLNFHSEISPLKILWLFPLIISMASLFWFPRGCDLCLKSNG